MKSFRSTWILGLVVVGLVAYVIWDFTEQKKADPLDPGQVRLTDFSLDQLKQLKVGDVELSFDGESCRILRPVEESCDNEIISSFVTLLGTLRAREVLKGADLNQERRKEFGLEEDQSLRISWELKSGEKSLISVGTKNSFDGGYFFEKGDVFLLDREVAQLTNKKLNEFRNKVPWSGPDEIQSVEVVARQSGRSFSMKKEESGWVWGSEQPFPLSDSKVNDWLDSVKKMKATNVFDEKPPEVGSSPNWKFVFNGLKDSSAELFESGDLIFVREANSSKFYQFPKQRLSSVLKEREDFFDPKAPFEFPLEKVTLVELKLGGKDLRFLKENGKWSSAQKKEQFQEDQLVNFFEALKKVEAQKFYQKAPSGLKFDQKVSLKDSSGKLLLELNWFGGKSALTEKGVRAVKTNRSDWTFGVSMNDIQQLEGIPFFKEEGSDEAVRSPVTDQN